MKQCESSSEILPLSQFREVHRQPTNAEKVYLRIWALIHAGAYPAEVLSNE